MKDLLAILAFSFMVYMVVCLIKPRWFFLKNATRVELILWLLFGPCIIASWTELVPEEQALTITNIFASLLLAAIFAFLALIPRLYRELVRIQEETKIKAKTSEIKASTAEEPPKKPCLEDWRILAARGAALTLQNKTDLSSQEALEKLSKITGESVNFSARTKLERINRLALDLCGESSFPHTAHIVGQCLSGFNEIERNEENIVGFLYLLESAAEYIKKLSRLRREVKRANSTELSESTEILLSKAEILNWLFLTRPQMEKSHGDIAEEMFSRVEETLDVHLKAKSYGAEAEGKALLDKALTAIREINEALDTMLKSALSRELLQTDAELDALRQEMRLRGLVKTGEQTANLPPSS